MNPVLYQINGVLLGSYLPGQYQWPFAVQLTTALLDCQGPPSAGVLALMLEVGGVLQGPQFTIAASSAPVEQPLTLNVLVPANTQVRWRAVFAGAPEAGAVQLSLTMQPVEQSISRVTVPTPALTLQYLSGGARTTLFNYDPVGNAYTEVTPGISSGLVALTQTGNTQLSIALPTVATLTIASGVITAPAFIARGGVMPVSSPVLLFCVNGSVIATLAQDGLRVVNLVEGTPVLAAPGSVAFASQFQFWSQGSLTGLLGSTGLTGLLFQEP